MADAVFTFLLLLLLVALGAYPSLKSLSSPRLFVYPGIVVAVIISYCTLLPGAVVYHLPGYHLRGISIYKIRVASWLHASLTARFRQFASLVAL